MKNFITIKKQKNELKEWREMAKNVNKNFIIEKFNPNGVKAML